MYKYFLFALISSTFCFSSCKKYADDAYDYYQIPMPLYFILLNSTGENIIQDSNKNEIKLFYLLDNKKEYVADFNIADSLSNHGYIGVTSDAAATSAVKNIKYFFLEDKNGDIDTLYIDVVEEKNKECMCKYPYKSVKFNGKVPQIDFNDQLNPYLFVK